MICFVTLLFSSLVSSPAKPDLQVWNNYLRSFIKLQIVYRHNCAAFCHKIPKCRLKRTCWRYNIVDLFYMQLPFKSHETQASSGSATTHSCRLECTIVPTVTGLATSQCCSSMTTAVVLCDYQVLLLATVWFSAVYRARGHGQTTTF